MNYALNDKDVQIHIDDATTGEHYKCPECKQRATARKGEIYRHHFAHYGQTKCGFYDYIPIAQPPKAIEHGPQNPTLDTPNVCPYAEEAKRHAEMLEREVNFKKNREIANAKKAEDDARRKVIRDKQRAYVQMRVRQQGQGHTITPAKRVYHESENVCDACRGTGQMYLGDGVDGDCMMCDISG